MTVIDGVLYGADSEVAAKINAWCGGPPPHYIQAALGVVNKGQLIGGVSFSNYQPGEDITITVAFADMTICSNPRVFARIAAYPFVQLGLPRVSAEIKPDNGRSLRNARKLGFVEEGVKRGSGVILMGLLKEDFVFKDLMPT